MPTSFDDRGQFTIYLAGCPGHSICKVGRTRNLRTRLTGLTPKFPSKPTALWTVEGTSNVETGLCRYLWQKGYASHGREWFDFGGKDPARVIRHAYRVIGPEGANPRYESRTDPQRWEVRPEDLRPPLWLRKIYDERG